MVQMIDGDQVSATVAISHPAYPFFAFVTCIYLNCSHVMPKAYGLLSKIGHAARFIIKETTRCTWYQVHSRSLSASGFLARLPCGPVCISVPSNQARINGFQS